MISFSETTSLTCPSCGAAFDAKLWALIDVGERPELRDALLEGTLNIATCPSCGWAGAAPAPLLIHDPAARRVYFAAPAGAEEHRVREQAQALLYTLVEGLPEEARLPYLGDVQVSQDLDGVRRAVLRHSRRGARARGQEAPAVAQGAPVAELSGRIPSSSPAPSPLTDAIQLLLAADSQAEFRATVAEHPELLGDAAGALLAELARSYQAQGEPQVVEALRRVRATLDELREQGLGDAGAEHGGAEAVPAPSPAPASLPGPAYQALLAADSPGALLDALRDYPALLDPPADAALAARAEEALDAGSERLAQAIELRREALADLRAELLADDALAANVGALLEARSEEALAGVLSEHPALLSAAAQAALGGVAARARDAGDERRAARAEECAAMLAAVRAGLEAA